MKHLDDARGGADNASMSRLQPESEYEALVYALERLSETYPFVGEDRLREIAADELAQLDQCVANATGCGEVQGCLAGAGLKRVLNDIGGLFRGIGEIFKSD